MGCMPTKLNTLSDSKSSDRNRLNSSIKKSKTRSSSVDGLSSTLEPRKNRKDASSSSRRSLSKSKSKEDKKGSKEKLKNKEKSKKDDKKASKEKLILEKKKSSDKPLKKPKVVSAKSFDERPLSGDKKAAAKSWWEMNEDYFSETADKPSYDKTISSENINEVKFDKSSKQNSHESKSDRLNETTGSRRSHRSDKLNDTTGSRRSNRSDRLNETTGSRRSLRDEGKGRNEDHFDTSEDDQSGNSNNASDFEEKENYNENLQTGGDERNTGDFDMNNSYGSQNRLNRSMGSNRSGRLNDTMGSRGFVENDDNDIYNSPRTLPSRPTNVPPNNNMGNDSGMGSSPTGFPPRPKFSRPLPLKRGAGIGMVNRAPVPVIRTPKETLTSILSRITTTEEAKFNEHLKLQKELVELVEKNPGVLTEVETDSLVKAAKKVVEVGSSNRTNLSRSAMICLGNLFEHNGSSLTLVTVEALTLCAKKGVSSSSELLIAAANFCLSRICAHASEPKVASQLVSLYRNNKAYQIITLSGLTVLLDRMGKDMIKLKNLDQIVDISVNGMSSGGAAARVVTRNILGMIKTTGNLDQYLNACRCTDIHKMTISQNLKRYDDSSKDLFIESFLKPNPL